MIRAKKKKKTCRCYNCSYDVTISPDTVKEKTFDEIIATYVECPVCGERLLKQLDTEETQAEAKKGVKLEMMQRSGKKLSPAKKKRLQSIETMLYNKRKILKGMYWDEVYQSLNQYKDEETGMADPEPTQGDTGISLRPITQEKGMNEHGTEQFDKI